MLFKPDITMPHYSNGLRLCPTSQHRTPKCWETKNVAPTIGRHVVSSSSTQNALSYRHDTNGRWAYRKSSG